jgi:O-antigen ligase
MITIQKRLNLFWLLEMIIWTGLCALFSLFIAKGAWVQVAGILAALMLFVMLTRYFHVLLCLWMAGIPTLFIFPNNVLHDILSALTVDRILYGILMATLLGSWLLKRSRPVPTTAVEKAMWVFLAVATLSLLSTAMTKPSKAVYDGFVMLVQGVVMPYSAFVLAKNQVWTEKGMERFFLLLIGVGLYLTVAGVLQFFFQITFFMPRYIDFDVEMDRATGTFFSPTEYGGVLSVILMLALLLYARAKDAVYRMVLLGFSALFTLGILLTKTRAVWVALLVALGVVYWKDRRVRGVLGIAGILGGVALIIALPFLLNSELFERRIAEQEPIYNRIALYATGLNIVIHNPIFGIGFGKDSFREAKFDYISSFGDVSAQWAAQPGVPHNELMLVLILTGLVGFTAYLIVLYRAYRLLDVAEAQSREKPMIRGELACFLKGAVFVYVTTGMFSDLIFFIYYVLLLYFILGMVASTVPDEECGGQGQGVVVPV